MIIKKAKTLKAIKVSLKKMLPSKISKVLQSYEDFLDLPIPDDAKGFNAHHSACKSAVIHAETLLKLAKWTENDDAPTIDCSNENDEILKILDEAKTDLDYDDEDI